MGLTEFVLLFGLIKRRKPPPPPQPAEHIALAFAAAVEDPTPIKRVDDLPASAYEILKSLLQYQSYLAVLARDFPEEFNARGGKDGLQEWVRLRNRLCDFFRVDAADQELIAELNQNWNRVNRALEDSDIGESERVWANRLYGIYLKYAPGSRMPNAGDEL